MKINELLDMIRKNQKTVEEIISTEGTACYLEDMVVTMLNTQHIVLESLYELLMLAKQEGKLQ